MKTKTIVAAAVLSCSGVGSAFATNGMLIEGYGPISHALGGASMAFDNGAAAMANNPATLGLMEEGNRFDVAVGVLKPDVTFKMDKDYKSGSRTFMMPALGYVHRQGDWGYGIGIYSQGGMGTDYLDELGLYSQVVVGKLIAPVSYNVTDKLTLAATLEYVYTGMDLVMTDPTMGRIFDFRNGSDFSGATSGSGVSGKLGAVYQFTDKVAVGAAYQFKGGIGDLTGKGARVEGFDMPASASIGVAGRVTDKLMLTADYQRVFWSDSMKTITVSQNGITMGIPQNWKDQNVFMLGAAYDVLPELTLRAGVNIANNPIKENNTPIFPAIVKNHYMAGLGYRFDKHNSLDLSFGYAPEVHKANGLNFEGTSTTHSQTSFQIMYSLKF